MGKSNNNKKNKFYAVKKGVKPGIYKTWNECKAQVLKFKGAIYKSFNSLSEAQQYMNIKSDEGKKSEAFAYIDGSFNKDKHIYGYGGFIMYQGEKYIIICFFDVILLLFFSTKFSSSLSLCFGISIVLKASSLAKFTTSFFSGIDISLFLIKLIFIMGFISWIKQ